jgi:proline iminopeptidase
MNPLLFALLLLMDGQDPVHAVPREGLIAVGGADLYFRDIGRGKPIVVLHGGPDFDHTYLLPDMDRLSDTYRLIYYDQRGRGRSAKGVRPEDVSIQSEIADLEKVREHFQLDSIALLGHSWGALLALEYAIRYPERVSHLILMNPAPVTKADFMQFREARVRQLGADRDRMKAIAATPGYQEGDPETVASYYRIHFKGGIRRPEDLEKVLAALRASFTREGILKARAVEARLVDETWLSDTYDPLTPLRRLAVPTLVIHSDHDFIPEESAAHIARAIPKARLARIKDCGHFAYLECPDAVRAEIAGLLR